MYEIKRSIKIKEYWINYNIKYLNCSEILFFGKQCFYLKLNFLFVYSIGLRIINKLICWVFIEEHCVLSAVLYFWCDMTELDVDNELENTSVSYRLPCAEDTARSLCLPSSSYYGISDVFSCTYFLIFNIVASKCLPYLIFLPLFLTFPG